MQCNSSAEEYRSSDSTIPVQKTEVFRLGPLNRKENTTSSTWQHLFITIKGTNFFNKSSGIMKNIKCKDKPFC